MTDKHADTERAIRDWLSAEAPVTAPASIRKSLENAASRPPASHGRLGWLSAGRVRPAFRFAAVMALIAVVAAGAYIHQLDRTSPAASQSPSARPTAHDSVASPSSSAASSLPSGWRLKSGAFPRMVAPAYSGFGQTVFQLPGSGGLMAFVPSTDGVARGGTSGIVLTAFGTAGPTSPASWTTHAFSSVDGLNWKETAALPSDMATVRDVTYSEGTIVAVGWTGVTPNETAVAWTWADLGPWRATKLPAQDKALSGAYDIAGGPGGFLAFGSDGSSSRFWISPDGIKWNVFATPDLPGELLIDRIYGNGYGWEIVGSLQDRSATWQSNRDGSVWTQTWTGPAMGSLGTDLEGYALGRILQAPDLNYVSFGGAYMAPGGNAALPSDTLIWTSTDALKWTESARVPSPGWIQGFASTAHGYVAAGQKVVGLDGMQAYGPLGVWTSGDTTSWTSLPGIESMQKVQVLSVVGSPYQIVVAFTDEQGNLQLLVSGT